MKKPETSTIDPNDDIFKASTVHLVGRATGIQTPDARRMAGEDLPDFKPGVVIPTERARAIEELRAARDIATGQEPSPEEEIKAMRLISECLSMYDAPTKKRMLNWINAVHYPLVKVCG